jgi:hypothetical protein
MAKTVRAKLAWLSAGVGSGTISRPSFEVEAQRRERQRLDSRVFGFFVDRYQFTRPGWRIYSSDIPPRSGPAPKVHWSM